MKLFVLLQSAASNLESTPLVNNVNYFNLLLKGGWIMLPIAILSVLAVYFILERWLIISKIGHSDRIWQSRVIELISESKIDQAIKLCLEKSYIIGKVIAEGLREIKEPIEDIEDVMETEARIQISRMESHMNYLGIISSIAPMLGFLGTIWGVINIFYSISQTSDLNIATISDGLYQKMICSGAGLLVGIVAYSGYYLLNGKIDKSVVFLDKESNEALRAIRLAKKSVNN